MPWSKSVRTGGKEAPHAWNDVTKLCWEKMVRRWRRDELGARVESAQDLPASCTRISHAIWADNVVFLSNTKKELQQMMQEATVSLLPHGLRWKPSSLQWWTAGEQDSEATEFEIGDGDMRWTVQYTEGTSLLGHSIDMTTNGHLPWEPRLHIAMRAYWRHAEFFHCRSISRKATWKQYVSQIQSKVLHACGSWTWGKKMAHKLANWEAKLLARMAGLWKREDETWQDYWNDKV